MWYTIVRPYEVSFSGPSMYSNKYLATTPLNTTIFYYYKCKITISINIKKTL